MVQLEARGYSIDLEKFDATYTRFMNAPNELWHNYKETKQDRKIMRSRLIEIINTRLKSQIKYYKIPRTKLFATKLLKS